MALKGDSWFLLASSADWLLACNSASLGKREKGTGEPLLASGDLRFRVTIGDLVFSLLGCVLCSSTSLMELVFKV